MTQMRIHGFGALRVDCEWCNTMSTLWLMIMLYHKGLAFVVNILYGKCSMEGHFWS
jgi:hypothetical protein